MSSKKGSALNHVLREIADTVANQPWWKTERCSLPLSVGVLEHLRAGIAGLQPAQDYRLALVSLDVGLKREGKVGKGFPLESFDAKNLRRFQTHTFVFAASHNHIGHGVFCRPATKQSDIFSPVQFTVTLDWVSSRAWPELVS